MLGKDRGDKSKALALPPSCFWSIGEAEGCIAVQKELECWQRPVHSESRGGVHGSDDGRGVTVRWRPGTKRDLNSRKGWVGACFPEPPSGTGNVCKGFS